MSRARFVTLALLAAATLAACSAPTAPAPAKDNSAPSFNAQPGDSTGTGRGGFQTGHG